MKVVAVALLRQGDRWFLQRRDLSNPVLPGCWEFPGGKAGEHEAPVDALIREVREEVGLEVREARPWLVFGDEIRVHAFFIEADGSPRTDLAWGWFRAEEMRRLPIPPLNVALVEQLIRVGSADLIT
jgi:8-oxo-dGTP pyrophosphatase MutT (NUDIX family)